MQNVASLKKGEFRYIKILTWRGLGEKNKINFLFIPRPQCDLFVSFTCIPPYLRAKLES